MPSNKAKYDMEYAKAHITRKFIPFNDNVPEDVELLAWLTQQDNVTQYIKRLIKEDFELQKGRNLAEKRRIRCQIGCQNENAHAGTVEE